MGSEGSSGDPLPPPTPDEAEAEAETETETESNEAPESDQLIAPEEEESMMCVYIPTQCETDSDCSDDFHCETHSYAVDCAVPVICEQSEEEGEDNALDENCYPAEPDVDCGEEEVTEGFCEPNEIECDSDDACPTDWRCQEVVDIACDEPSITTSSAREPERDEGEPEADEVAPREPEDCAETTRSMCVPVGVDYVSHDAGDHRDPMPGSDPETDPLGNEGDDGGNGSDGGDGNDSNNDNDGNDGDDDDNPPAEVSDNNDVEESSCSANSRGASPWTLFGLLALLGLRRRAVALD